MTLLRLGILGMSEGNGHPYSWSAIFNGYDRATMADCPFPAIPTYLAKQRFPDDAIPDARVTHIWTQDRAVSERIARATRIESIVNRSADMIGHVDAVLLARDDAEHHFEMAEPFLRAGLPVYIDKPLAITVAEAQRIYGLERYPGQIYSCSALRFSRDLALDAETRERIGKIVYVQAQVMKSWERYGVHVIEQVLQLLGDTGDIRDTQVSASGDRRIVTLRWGSGVQTSFAALGAIECPIAVRVFGTRGMEERIFGDTFHAFREALLTFVASVRQRTTPIPREQVLKVVDVIERGLHAG